MKKVKNLPLNKQSISVLDSQIIKGGAPTITVGLVVTTLIITDHICLTTTYQPSNYYNPCIPSNATCGTGGGSTTVRPK